jgi:nucleotide-binding universal stress UspA family protein
MIVIKHILVPTDFSEPALVAMKYARALAENFGASLHLLHVIEENSLDYFAWTSPVGSPAMASVQLEMEKTARFQLEQMMTADERTKFELKIVTLVGSPFLEIIRYARSQNIDLIIMGTHGRGPIAHMLMGSVAEKVVRKAPCPVLTVRHPEHEFVMP